MKSKTLKRIVMLIVLVAVVAGVYEIFKGKMNVSSDYNVVKEENSDNIYKEDVRAGKEEEKKIINILLLGIDKQENVSDTIMILSLNDKNKTIKLVSIMRDTYVYQGQNMANKINYAYNYGGVEGSMDTINSIFNLNIDKYIKVDFEGLINIVDYLGGVEINIDEAEKNYINARYKKSVIGDSGNVKLNGEQILIFSRIRSIDSDFQRTQRQRLVMYGIFNKIRGIDMVKYPKAIYRLSKSSETNLSMIELLELGDIIYNYNDSDLSEFRIPIDGTSSDNSGGVYHLNWDEEENKKALENFLNN